MEIGATFSHRFATEIGLNMIESLEEIIDLDMDWIRLACYWSCIARWDDREGLEFDFDEMRAMLEICEERIVKVIMVIGNRTSISTSMVVANKLSTKPMAIPSPPVTNLTTNP